MTPEDERLAELYSRFVVVYDAEVRSGYYRERAEKHEHEAEAALERGKGLPHTKETVRQLRMVAAMERHAAHTFKRIAELLEEADDAAFTVADRKLIASIDADSLPDPEALYLAPYTEQRWDTE